MPIKNRKNFSFDLGMASLGVAVNENDEIIHADVLLMHLAAGSVRAQAGRRMFRTREAHKTREAILESLWRSIGKEPLQRKRFTKTKNAKGKREFIKTKADDRLEREFPAQGDDTVYTSCLLRIMLLEGQPMADWQIYKALHASIQRRGYDANVPWKTGEAQPEKPATKDENPENQIDRFATELREMTPDERYHLPCYYDAWKMGLWDESAHEITAKRQYDSGKPPETTRGYNASREIVTKEIIGLLNRATEQMPELKKHLAEDKLEQLLYGTQHNAIDKRYPSATRIDGLLGQKYPRFENRIVAKCALIPRLNVCKAEKPLAIEVGFLLRLVNWRYEKEDEHGNKLVASLTGKELMNKFHECEDIWKKKAKQYIPKNDAEEYAKCFRFIKSKKGKVPKMAESLGGIVKMGHEDIPASKHTGRSRFSQPALHLMKSLILSEKTPQDFYKELSQLVTDREIENPGAEFGYKLFDDAPYRYFPDDFRFLEKMGNSREAIHVPDISLAERYSDDDGDVESAIQRIINSCNWPELRHRLKVFRHELENLAQKYGKPDAVHLEFIREDFLSDKKKKKYTDQAEAGKENHRKAVEELKNLNISVTDENILRYRLYEEQNKQCLYTGEAIDIGQLESYDIDHIFPKGDGGPDAYYNKVLTSGHVNRKLKGKRLPCECDFINWATLKTRLDPLSLGKNKKKLLLASTREEAEELAEKYTGLAGTAHIARLARDIVCLRFGWQPGAKDEQQRIFVISGGLTSKVAKKYELYKALGDGTKKYQKDRSDHRHHALDAMVISYLPQWARDKNKRGFFKFPKGIDANYFGEKLNGVFPRYITRMRPAIAEQPKSKKDVNKKEFKNISKDHDERGQWYGNKSETGKGTSQHGYLFYKDKQGKLCSKTIHSFRSRYQSEKEVEKKASEILGFFYRGKSIFLPAQSKITATQLGRDARLDFSDYRVAQVNNQNIIIESIPKQDDESVSRYRINPAMLKQVIMTNQLMTGKSLELVDFSIKKGELLNGRYKVDPERSDDRYFTIVNTESGEEKFIKSNRLISHLIKQESTNLIGENATVAINRNHRNYIGKVTTDDLPKQNLPEGHYQIKGFGGSGKRVELVAQNGTVYQMNSKILQHVTLVRDD